MAGLQAPPTGRFWALTDIGSLLTHFVEGLRRDNQSLTSALSGENKLSGDLRVDRYVFKTAEEHRWGPDFALMMPFPYSLFQAKLIEGRSIKVDTVQLKNMLRASWHSAFYVAWNQSMLPKCVPAAFLAEVIDRMDVPSSPYAATTITPRIRWEKLATYSDSFVDLLCDRLLCGELGDPFGDTNLNQPAELVKHLVAKVGPFPYGVIGINLVVQHDKKAVVSVAAEPQTIVVGYPTAEGDRV
jgi:hypothetical protein